MNAYELADYITENSYIGSVTMDDVANMLRQQADRIAELETNPEPVAWINREVGSGSILDWEKDPWSEINIPLYTTPQTKPLSDEEIPLMTILQNAQSVRLGDAIYKDDAEYEKLKKIVIASVKWTQERHGIK